MFAETPGKVCMSHALLSAVTLEPPHRFVLTISPRCFNRCLLPFLRLCSTSHPGLVEICAMVEKQLQNLDPTSRRRCNSCSGTLHLGTMRQQETYHLERLATENRCVEVEPGLCEGAYSLIWVCSVLQEIPNERNASLWISIVVQAQKVADDGSRQRVSRVSEHRVDARRLKLDELGHDIDATSPRCCQKRLPADQGIGIDRVLPREGEEVSDDLGVALLCRLLDQVAQVDDLSGFAAAGAINLAQGFRRNCWVIEKTA